MLWQAVDLYAKVLFMEDFVLNLLYEEKGEMDCFDSISLQPTWCRAS